MLTVDILNKLKITSKNGDTSILNADEIKIVKKFCQEKFRYSINENCSSCLKKYSEKILETATTLDWISYEDGSGKEIN